MVFVQMFTIMQWGAQTHHINIGVCSRASCQHMMPAIHPKGDDDGGDGDCLGRHGLMVCCIEVCC